MKLYFVHSYSIKEEDILSLKAWQNIPYLTIKHYPWYKEGDKQDTYVRMCYDKKNIYLFFICEDKHSYAQYTELNSPVCNDSCVEFFASVNPNTSLCYFNLEINCCGTFLMGFGPDRYNRKRITQELAREIKIISSIPTPTKEESPEDEEWRIGVILPFEIIKKFTQMEIHPRIWRANFFRCGGRVSSQYACWSYIKTPKPDYHRPEFFGEIEFL